MHSVNDYFSFQIWTKEQIQNRYSQRSGEVRVGDKLMNSSLENAKYVLIGINECCGPLENNGRPGAQNAFSAFTKAFLNTQIHDGFPGENVLVLGEVMENHSEHFSGKVSALDDFLLNILDNYVQAHQIPIFIGGGHNNALPLIRWAARHKKTAVVNLDAHADLRSTENRHSGNSFSTAFEEGSLFHYSVFGLHEAYNNSFIREALENDQVSHSYFESYLFKKRELLEDLSNVLRHFHSNTHVGLEIDMDAIAYMPSSALSPSGWSLDQVRQFVHHFRTNQQQIAYLNLTEAAPNDDGEMLIVGKSLSYLVRDFIGL